MKRKKHARSKSIDNNLNKHHGRPSEVVCVCLERYAIFHSVRPIESKCVCLLILIVSILRTPVSLFIFKLDIKLVCEPWSRDMGGSCCCCYSHLFFIAFICYTLYTPLLLLFLLLLLLWREMVRFDFIVELFRIFFSLNIMSVVVVVLLFLSIKCRKFLIK